LAGRGKAGTVGRPADTRVQVPGAHAGPGQAWRGRAGRSAARQGEGSRRVSGTLPGSSPEHPRGAWPSLAVLGLAKLGLAQPSRARPGAARRGMAGTVGRKAYTSVRVRGTHAWLGLAQISVAGLGRARPGADRLGNAGTVGWARRGEAKLGEGFTRVRLPRQQSGERPAPQSPRGSDPPPAPPETAATPAYPPGAGHNASIDPATTTC
jgi:hypothetical protein